MNIMGESILTKSQMKTYLLSMNKSPKLNTTVDQLIDFYLLEGSIEGVRGDIAFAQSIVETRSFYFGGDVLWTQNNYAGLGATGGGVRGENFTLPQIGIRAQIQHLKAYASTDPLEQPCVDNRFKYVKRGIAPTVDELSGT